MNRWIRDNLKTQYIHIQLTDQRENTLNVSKYIEVPMQDGYGKEDHWVREYIQDKLDDFCSKISEEVDNIMKELVEWVEQVMMEEE